MADHFASQMADILTKIQTGDLEKNIEEIVKNMGGLELPEEGENGGEGSSTGTKDTQSTSNPTSVSEQEQADLEKMLSALAALDESSGNPESTAASITEKLKKLAENAKNISV